MELFKKLVRSSSFAPLFASSQALCCIKTSKKPAATTSTSANPGAQGATTSKYNEGVYANYSQRPKIAAKCSSPKHAILAKSLETLDSLNFGFLCAVVESLPMADMRGFMAAVAEFFHWKGRSVDVGTMFLEKASAEEVLDLRRNSPVTNWWVQYCRITCVPYIIDTIGPLVKEITQSPQEAEIMPEKLKDPREAELNVLVLMSYCDKLRDALDKTVSKVPNQVRLFFRNLRTERERKNIEESKILDEMMALFLLRLVTPAVMSPHTYCVAKEPPPHKALRKLILVCKIAQNSLAHTSLSREFQHLEKLRDWHTAQANWRAKFLESLAPQNENLAVDNGATTVEIPDVVGLSSLGVILTAINGLHNEITERLEKAAGNDPELLAQQLALLRSLT